MLLFGATRHDQRQSKAYVSRGARGRGRYYYIIVELGKDHPSSDDGETRAALGLLGCTLVGGCVLSERETFSNLQPLPWGGRTPGDTEVWRSEVLCKVVAEMRLDTLFSQAPLMELSFLRAHPVCSLAAP